MKQRIKILHVIGSLSKGGAEHQCTLLCNNLDQSTFDVSIMCFDFGPNAENAKHVHTLLVNRGRKSNIIGLWMRIYHQIKELNPDIVHVWLPEIISVPSAVIAKYLGKPVISGHRNSIKSGVNFNKQLRDILRLPQYFICDKIISNFNINEEPLYFRLLYKFKNGQKIANGLRFNDRANGANNKRHKGRYVFIGRLAPQKNLPLIFHTLRHLKDLDHSVHLTVFGEGHPAYKKRLEKLIQALDLTDNVIFKGYDQNWGEYAKEYTALMFPSTAEGTSNVVLESLALGLPVFISNISMAKEILCNKENAIIVSANKAKVWANQILEFEKDEELRQKLVIGGAALVKTYSVSKMVTSYERLYKEISLV